MCEFKFIYSNGFIVRKDDNCFESALSYADEVYQRTFCDYSFKNYAVRCLLDGELYWEDDLFDFDLLEGLI